MGEHYRLNSETATFNYIGVTKSGRGVGCLAVSSGAQRRDVRWRKTLRSDQSVLLRGEGLPRTGSVISALSCRISICTLKSYACSI